MAPVSLLPGAPAVRCSAALRGFGCDVFGCDVRLRLNRFDPYQYSHGSCGLDAEYITGAQAIFVRAGRIDKFFSLC
jgi:hypothetical protein